MPLILGTNSIKDTGFDVANSLRFNRGSSDSLTRTQSSSPTHDDKGTLSFWFKRSLLGVDQYVFSVFQDSNNRMQMNIKDDDQLKLIQKTGGSTVISLITNRVFRDVSAWYHVVVSIDTTQGTASNRIKIYINGVQETSFGTETYPSQNENVFLTKGTAVSLGAYDSGSSDHTSAYFSEIVMVDGQQLDPTSFGEFDEDNGIWKPIDVSGLTFGTNGFYLDFEDSSALGNDAAGSNNFTVNNLTAIDQSTDTCTNNFCTMNPLDNYYAGATFSEGNLKFVHGVSAWNYNTATFGLSSGKWYWEMKCVDAGSGGIGDQPTVGIANDPPTESGNYLGKDAYAWGYRSYQQNVINNGSQVLGSLSTFTDGDIIGVYMDLDNNKLYFSKNGTLENSTGISLTAPASTTTGFYFPAAGDNKDNASTTWEANFGSPSFAISSGNADDNGYGNFEYSPNITGDSTAKKFYACNTKNLAEYG